MILFERLEFLIRVSSILEIVPFKKKLFLICCKISSSLTKTLPLSWKIGLISQSPCKSVAKKERQLHCTKIVTFLSLDYFWMVGFRNLWISECISITSKNERVKTLTTAPQMHEKYFFCLYFCCCVFMCFEFLDEARFSQEVNKTRKLSIPTHRF